MLQRPIRKVAMLLAAVSMLVLGASAASASTTVIVRPSSPNGWASADTRPGGEIHFVADATSPYPGGALQLKTDATTAAKAQYLRAETMPLSAVTEVGYWNRTLAGPAVAAASFQLLVDLNGTAVAGGFTTLVYEPYWNGSVPTAWTPYDVDAGIVWSSSSFTSGACAVVSGAGGPPFYTLAGLQASCPDAELLAIGVNVGTYNVSYDTLVDGVTLNGTVYDFELDLPTPAGANDCKKGGWQSLYRADGSTFKNQGDCIQYVNTGK